MTTERQIAANRENAQKSTGPRTPHGKAISSRNNARHGLYSSAPVIPRLESVTAWDYHRLTTVQSLAPANAIEDALAERIALLLWRLGRVARYEQAIATHAQHDAPNDVAAEYEHTDLDAAKIRTRFAHARRCLRAFERFCQLRPEVPMTGLEAGYVLDTIGHQLPDFDYENFAMPGLFCAEDRLGDIPGWTAARVRQVLDAIAEATGRNQDDLLQAGVAAALRECNQARTPYRHLARRLDDLRQQRVLPNTADLRSVARYESHLGRQLNQTLTQLRLLQRHREAGHGRPAHNDYHAAVPRSGAVVGMAAVPRSGAVVGMDDLADDPDPAPPQATHW